jgi:hypothetical protein
MIRLALISDKIRITTVERVDKYFQSKHITIIKDALSVPHLISIDQFQQKRGRIPSSLHQCQSRLAQTLPGLDRNWGDTQTPW